MSNGFDNTYDLAYAHEFEDSILNIGDIIYTIDGTFMVLYIHENNVEIEDIFTHKTYKGKLNNLIPNIFHIDKG